MNKILIANRGEIAVRVIRACRDMGIVSVAVYSECDRVARHVRMADEAYPIGGNSPGESYLRIDTIIDVARMCGAEGIHPGYGFLSENKEFSAACRDAGIEFLGPSPEVIERMGSKTAAREVAIKVGAPVVPGTEGALGTDVSDDAIARLAEPIGFPLMVKAVAGGGGKGMRVVTSSAELSGAVRAARSEAGASFGDSAIFIERRIDRARHIEVQLLGDQHGTVVPFVERECSLQRRHQKVIEETPSAKVSQELRILMATAAADIARFVGYSGAGTIEFLLDEDGEHFYFLEMNTRLQVEHPITEMVSGVDLVEWQIRIARGEKLTLDPARTLQPNGHAIECRIIAEDPDAGFMPSPGYISTLRVPTGPGIRDDGGTEQGGTVPIYYDPMISKLIAWGQTREQATARMKRALSEYDVVGIKTSIPFHRWMLNQPEFETAEFDTTYLDRLLKERQGEPFMPAGDGFEEIAAVVAALSTVIKGSPGAPAAGAQSRGNRWTAQARSEGLRS